MDSAIGEHLLTINSCRTSYEDDFHLKFLEAIYISMNRPSLCKQLNNHTLNIWGELLNTGMTEAFFCLFFVVVFFTSYLAIQIIQYIPPFLSNFPVHKNLKSAERKGLHLFYYFIRILLSLPMVSMLITLYKFSCTRNLIIIYIYDTLSSLPGRSKYSRIFSCPDGITPNSGLTGLSILYIYIYIYVCVCVCVCVARKIMILLVRS